MGIALTAILLIANEALAGLYSSSARGCGAATPLLLGSATQKVLAHSRIPVLVYRKSAAHRTQAKPCGGR